MNKILNQPSHEELEELLSQNSYVHKYVKTRRRAGVAIKKQHTKKIFKIISRVSIFIIDESWQLLIPRDQKRPRSLLKDLIEIGNYRSYSNQRSWQKYSD